MEELTRAAMKKLTQGMAEHNKTMAAAKSDEEKGCIVRLFQENSVSLVELSSWQISYNRALFLCRKLKSRILLLDCVPATTFWQ